MLKFNPRPDAPLLYRKDVQVGRDVVMVVVMISVVENGYDW